MVRLWLKKLLEKHEAHAARPSLHFIRQERQPGAQHRGMSLAGLGTCRWAGLPRLGLILASWVSWENRSGAPPDPHLVASPG